ncbi:hypothetical protein [Nonomuraea roseoviolacea]|uniref:hypothetical protein n=1 Tax=Nonomuraea roseoviolacea TaxID=103837 RepID=UPI0031E34E79
MSTDPDLRTALDHLYETFSRHPLPEDTVVCDHCVPPELVRAARTGPLRSLGAEALEPYAWNHSTWGGEADFRHYLPRLLELLITEEMDGWFVGPILAGRAAAHWHDWPDDERDAVVAAVGLWWRETLGAYPRELDAPHLLEIIGREFRLDPAPYLAAWEEMAGEEAAARHVAALVRDWRGRVAGRDAWYAAVDAWLAGPAPARLLREGLAGARSPRAERELRAALDLWEEPRHRDLSVAPARLGGHE